MHQLAAFTQRIKGAACRFRAVHQVNNGAHGAATGFHDALGGFGIAALHDIGGPFPLGDFKLGGADIHHHNAPMAFGLQHGNGVQAKPARPDHHNGFIRRHGHDLIDGAEHRNAGTRIGRGQGGIQVTNRHQMARFRRQHMCRIATMLINAEAFRREAHIILILAAGIAGAAADPGEDHHMVADLKARAIGIWPPFHYAAHNFMSHGQRQLNPAVRELQVAA